MKKVVIIPLLFFASLIFLFPYIASSPLGKPFVLYFLQRDLPGHLTIDKIHLSWIGPQKFEKTALNFAACTLLFETVSLRIPLWQLPRWEQHVELQNGSFACPEYPEGEVRQIQATIQNQHIQLTGIAAHKGSLSIQGTLPWHHNPFNLVVSLQNIPTIALDNLLQCNRWLHNSLGNLCTIESTYRYVDDEETVSIDLTSSYAKSSLRANIKDNVLTLTSPWVSTLFVSDSLRKAILTYMKPQWITDIQFRNPISLQIFPDGFSCPLFPFSFDKIQVKQGIFQFGKTLVQSDQVTRFLMTLLKGKGVTNPILCWFTKMPFLLQKGILSFNRFDALLSQSIHLCAWGSMDLMYQKLQMVLGIPVGTLANVIDISPFPSNYVFKIPVRGTFAHPEFDTSPTFGKLATIAIAQQLPTKPRKTIGGIINTVVPHQGQSDVPPPDRPFPWEK